MNLERGLFENAETPEQAADADARARASAAAGKVVPHEKVVAWLKTWGTPEAGPPPKEWLEQAGLATPAIRVTGSSAT